MSAQVSLLRLWFIVSGAAFFPNVTMAAHVANDARWDDRFAPPGAQGIVMAMAFDQQRVYLGGQLQSVGPILAEAVVQGDGQHWRSLPGGPQSHPLLFNVQSLAHFDGDLYAGGAFALVGSQPSGGLARWDGRSWSVPGGTNGQVYLLRSDLQGLYVSGRFALPGNTNLVTLARWDGRQWESLADFRGACAPGTFCPEEVFNFELLNGEVLAYVSWDRARFNLVSGLARLDASGRWSPFHSPSESSNAWDHYVLATYRGQWVAAGAFTNRAEPLLRHVAFWDGLAWRPMGEGLPGEVLDIVGNDRLLVALHSIPSPTASSRWSVAAWDGSRWLTLGTNAFEARESPLRVFLSPMDEVYVTGSFSGIRPDAASNVIRWDGTRWAPVFEGDFAGLAGFFSSLFAFAEHQGDVYLGGAFTTAGDVFSPGIARWDGRRMQDVGGGLDSQFVGVVRALTSSGTHLFAGGTIRRIGGIAATNIAAWNGTSWQALGTGLSSSPTTLAWLQDSLFAGGHFREDINLGEPNSANLARWDGVTWHFSSLGSNASVNALVVWRDQLYAGGGFLEAGSASVSRLARWDGARWHHVGGGVSGEGRVSVARLAAGSDGLYVAGSFSQAGTLPVTNIARWDGMNWHALGPGWPGSISALATRGGIVYVGGRMTNEMGVVRRLGRWDGQAWSSLGSDIADPRGGNFGRVFSLWAMEEELLVGGLFTSAGGKPSAGIARWMEIPRLK